jgi:hypothetical protein
VKNRVHVADRIEMDQEPDAGDDQQHDATQRVDQEGEVDVQIAAEDPPVGDDFARPAGLELVGKHREGGGEGQPDRAAGDAAGDVVRITASQQAVEQHRHEGKHRDGEDQ